MVPNFSSSSSSSSSSSFFLHCYLFLLLSSLLFFLLVVVYYHLYVLRRLNGRIKWKKLPPGSMGWPFLGETLELFNQNTATFFSKRINRYGDVFKTHILGCPCIMVSNPDTIKQVLMKNSDLFRPTFPTSKERMIGQGALNFHGGLYHASLKKLVHNTFLPSSIKRFVPKIEDIVLETISCWENKIINTHREMKKFAFEVAMLATFGDHENQDLDKESFRELYQCVHDGYNSMPFDIPGFAFHKAMKARKQLGEMLEKIIEKRRKEKSCGDDLVGVLLGSEDQNILQLKVSQIVDNIFAIIFSAQDTTASTLTWIFKYLHDNISLLKLVEEEQEEILKDRIRENRGLTWDDTKRMSLTVRVIQESLRLASVVGFTFREAEDDVEVENFLIPKGWKVLPLFASIHHCDDFFPNPNTFDPSRFEMPIKPNTFMPFGSGIHSCPGNELAKLEILILLHHLITKLRWDVVCKEDGIQYSPFPIPKKGLPIKVTRKE